MRCVGIVVAIGAIAGCLINRRTTEFACEGTTDCDPGRVCENGFCVIGTIDAPQEPDAPTCPSVCTTCDLVAITCSIECDTPNQCGTVQCPDGYACTISCTAQNACDDINCGKGRSCDITCSDTNACNTINCGMGRCDVTCSASDACNDVKCADSCECDVDCAAGNCNSTQCPMANGSPCTEDGTSATPCASTGAGCDLPLTTLRTSYAPERKLQPKGPQREPTGMVPRADTTHPFARSTPKASGQFTQVDGAIEARVVPQPLPPDLPLVMVALAVRSDRRVMPPAPAHSRHLVSWLLVSSLVATLAVALLFGL